MTNWKFRVNKPQAAHGSDAGSLINWPLEAMIQEQIERGSNGETLLERHLGIYIKDVMEVVESLQKLNYTLIRVAYNGRGNKPSCVNLSHATGYVQIESMKDESSVAIFSTNKELFESTSTIFLELLKLETKNGYVWVLEDDCGYVSLARSSKKVGVPLIRGNYSPAVLKSYDRIAQQITSDNPSGRLSIIEGEAGTGKTHLIRGLLNEISTSRCILLPPSMTSSLVNPRLMKLLLNAAKHTKYLILILEDADGCLLPRMGDNMSEISALLNMSDGIMSTMTETRIIVTTNARKVEIDKALLRRGRLCEHVAVGKLSAETAENIFVRLTGKEMENKDNKPMTLAEAYGKAYDYLESQQA